MKTTILVAMLMTLAGCATTGEGWTTQTLPGVASCSAAPSWTTHVVSTTSACARARSRPSADDSFEMPDDGVVLAAQQQAMMDAQLQQDAAQQAMDAANQASEQATEASLEMSAITP
ncbi:MAG: hypothetical protein JST54_33780 [Deltaproteobacteria bacterium]|nr:hypothetical protein [Deltaproteobacteria bacterium]